MTLRDLCYRFSLLPWPLPRCLPRPRKLKRGAAIVWENPAAGRAKGEAWYVSETKERFYLGRPDDAFQIMRKLGLGITNADLALIPESNQTIAGNAALRQRLSGTILLQVEAHGEAWYVYPDNLKRY